MKPVQQPNPIIRKPHPNRPRNLTLALPFGKNLSSTFSFQSPPQLNVEPQAQPARKPAPLTASNTETFTSWNLHYNRETPSFQGFSWPSGVDTTESRSLSTDLFSPRTIPPGHLTRACHSVNTPRAVCTSTHPTLPSPYPVLCQAGWQGGEHTGGIPAGQQQPAEA